VTTSDHKPIWPRKLGRPPVVETLVARQCNDNGISPMLTIGRQSAASVYGMPGYRIGRDAAGLIKELESYISYL
jgi:hypothetical protein